MIQEHWLYDYEFDIIRRELPNSFYVAKSSMNSCEISHGRPSGGVAIIWKNGLSFSVDSIDTISNRLCACKVEGSDFKFLLVNVYMPINNISNNDEFNEILYEVIALTYMYDSYNLIFGGDFNCSQKNNNARFKIFDEFVDLFVDLLFLQHWLY